MTVPSAAVDEARRQSRAFRFNLSVAVVTLAFTAAAMWGVPALDSALTFRETTAADVPARLAPNVSIIPPAGWTVTDGEIAPRSTPAENLPNSLTLTRGGTTVVITTAPWMTSTPALLKQIRAEDAATSSAVFTGTLFTFTSDSGVPARMQQFDGGHVHGLIAAFVANGTGVEVVVRSATDDPNNRSVAEVGRLLTSLRIASKEQ